MEILIVCLIIMFIGYKLGQKNPNHNLNSLNNRFNLKQENYGSFNLDSNEWPAFISVSPQERTYKINSYTPDRLSDFNSIYEYRILGNEIEIRLLEKSSEHAGEGLSYTVKSNIFLEEQFEKQNSNSILKSLIEDKKKQILKEIFWHKLENNFIRLFVLAHHPEFINIDQIKDEIKNKIIMLSKAIDFVRKDIEALGGEFNPWPSDKPTGYASYSTEQNTKEKLTHYYEKGEFKKYQITEYEISYFYEIKNKYIELLDHLS